ncbi:Fc.00g096700.m01.CDS01 [Cosmosporella sp. VM-42]
MAARDQVKKTLLIVSDTRGYEFTSFLPIQNPWPLLMASIWLLEGLNAPLKLVIARKHDIALDVHLFRKKVDKPSTPLDMSQVKKDLGDFGETGKLFEDAADAGIVFLDEGNDNSNLANGASLCLYASPFTRSVLDWGFVYRPEYDQVWDIKEGVELFLTRHQKE